MNRTADCLARYRPEIILLVIFLAASLGLDLAGLDPSAEPDTATYVEPAQSIARGDGYRLHTNGDLRPYTHRTPGYPLFLSLFYVVCPFAPIAAAVWTQRLLWACIVLFLPPSARTSTGDFNPLALVGKFILLLSPLSLLYASYLLSDILFAIVLTAGLFSLTAAIRTMNSALLILSAILLGFSAWVRPLSIALPPLLFAASFLYLRRRPLHVPAARKFLTLIVIALLISSAFPLSWSIRNAAVAGHFSFSPLGGQNLFRNVAPLAESADRTTDETAERPLIELLKTEEDARAALSAMASLYAMDEFEVSRHALTAAIQLMAKNPARYLGLTLKNLASLFLSPDASFRLFAILAADGSIRLGLSESLRQKQILPLFMHVFSRAWNAVFFLIFPGLLILRYVKTRRPVFPLLIFAISAAYFIVMTCALIPTYDRLLLPVLPSLLFLYTAFHSHPAADGSHPPLHPEQ